MDKFTINFEILGYKKVDIDDDRICNPESTVILLIDEEQNSELYKYYNRVIDIILSGAKLILISVGDESTIRRTIMMLMMSYRNYNIYRVSYRDIVTEEYIRKIENMKPTIIDVQQYIGGNVAAYGELNNILFGLKDILYNGDTDSIKTFLEQHIESIDESAELVEYLKKIFDNTNSGEINRVIESLKSKVESAEQEEASLKAELKQTKRDNINLKEELNTAKDDLTKANRKIVEFENRGGSDSRKSTLSEYNTLNVSLIKNKTGCIIYIKEISYVRYMNSLIDNLLKFIQNTNKNINTKLIIFDKKVNIQGIYKGINIYNSETYIRDRQSIIKNASRYVVTEPNRMFLQDILESTSPEFNVVIVYDRLGQPNSLITGNVVTNIYVVNSGKQYRDVKDSLKISATSTIICGDNSVEGALTIDEIEDYNKQSESAKVAKYAKQKCNDGRIPLRYILEKARVGIS